MAESQGKRWKPRWGVGGLLNGKALAGFKRGGGKMCMSPGGKCCICDRKTQHITSAVCPGERGLGP